MPPLYAIEKILLHIRASTRHAEFSLRYPPIAEGILDYPCPHLIHVFRRLNPVAEPPESVPGKMSFGGGERSTEGIDELLGEIGKLTKGEEHA